jgi:hypothetical protein
VQAFHSKAYDDKVAQVNNLTEDGVRAMVDKLAALGHSARRASRGAGHCLDAVKDLLKQDLPSGPPSALDTNVTHLCSFCASVGAPERAQPVERALRASWHAYKIACYSNDMHAAAQHCERDCKFETSTKCLPTSHVNYLVAMAYSYNAGAVAAQKRRQMPVTGACLHWCVWG